MLAFVEYACVAAALGAPRAACRSARRRSLAACAAVGGGYFSVDVVLMTAVIVVGSLAVGSRTAWPAPSCAIRRRRCLPVLYLGLPLGALAAVRALAGREAVLLLMATIVVSDTAQYYSGRAFGRRPLAPSISPKKTVEGALGGMIFGTLAMVAGGRYVLPRRQPGAPRGRQRRHRGAGHRRRPVRVAAEAQRRREGPPAR